MVTVMENQSSAYFDLTFSADLTKEDTGSLLISGVSFPSCQALCGSKVSLSLVFAVIEKENAVGQAFILFYIFF